MPLKKCRAEGCTRLAAGDFCSLHTPNKPQQTTQQQQPQKPLATSQPSIQTKPAETTKRQRRHREWQPRAKTCAHCKEPKDVLDAERFFCKRWKWIVPNKLARHQAVCSTKESEKAEEPPEILVESAEE